MNQQWVRDASMDRWPSSCGFDLADYRPSNDVDEPSFGQSDF
jgi:hypothetical protein